MSQFTQLVLVPEVTSPQKPIPTQRRTPVMLARYHTECGFCSHPLLKGQPIYRMDCGKWAHVHDANDKDIARRGAQLVGEAMLKKTGSRLVQDGAFTRIVGCTCSACLNGQPEICVGDWED